MSTDTAPSAVVHHGAADNVVVARVETPKGTYVPSEGVTTLHDVPLGHKVATRPIGKGEAIFAKILAVASGEKSTSEALGVGEDEFVPWPIGVAG
jgi:hypothetical protein